MYIYAHIYIYTYLYLFTGRALLTCVNMCHASLQADFVPEIEIEPPSSLEKDTTA